jgi:mono/diheme cytochrome c family protein
MHMKNTLIAVSLAGLAVLAAAAAFAQASAGVYTDAQATRGAAVFTGSHCIMCHGATLAGSDQAPPLAGDAFMANWTGQSLGDLATRIHTTMPGDNPGSLTDAQVADVVAYILQQNKFKSGAKEFPTDAAGQSAITLDAKP